jgi:site-specific recombinase XerD
MLTEPPTVRLLGKGNKVRLCPLWADAAQLLQRYVSEHRRRPLPGHDHYVFINQRGQHLTRFGIGRIVSKYLERAAQRNQKLVGKRLSTHSIRHSTAIHLLQAGAELNVIRTWLGHSSMSSTSHYLDLNLETQRDMLTRFTAPPSLTELSSVQAKPTENTSTVDLSAWLEKL